MDSLYNKIDKVQGCKNKLDILSKRYCLQEFKDFTNEVVSKEINENNVDTMLENINMTYYVLYYLKEKKMYNPINPNKMIDTAILAILMHNLYYDGNPNEWEKVFLVRKNMIELDKPYRTVNSNDGFDYVYQIIESQLGEAMPIPALRPQVGSIAALVWTAIWFKKHQYNSDDTKVEILELFQDYSFTL